MLIEPRTKFTFLSFRSPFIFSVVALHKSDKIYLWPAKRFKILTDINAIISYVVAVVTTARRPKTRKIFQVHVFKQNFNSFVHIFHLHKCSLGCYHPAYNFAYFDFFTFILRSAPPNLHRWLVATIYIISSIVISVILFICYESIPNRGV